MCLRISHLLTQNNLWGSVMPCGHHRCVVLVLVGCISKIDDFHVRILQRSLIPLLQIETKLLYKYLISVINIIHDKETLN